MMWHARILARKKTRAGGWEVIMSMNLGNLEAISIKSSEPETSAKAQALLQLAEKWERSARKRFECADGTDDPMGKRSIEHGSVLLFNCAREIREYLASL
jgi:hypothetical protein